MSARTWAARVCRRGLRRAPATPAVTLSEPPQAVPAKGTSGEAIPSRVWALHLAAPGDEPTEIFVRLDRERLRAAGLTGLL